VTSPFGQVTSRRSKSIRKSSRAKPSCVRCLRVALKEYFDTLHVFHTFAIETVRGAGNGRESNLREVAETYTRS
jgi:hypothetical protein